ncbi:hypothetical protein [Spirilliplanes yamanashiensis]|uniref:Uncharacterized protein n=1 Tax=Spirilliplanes yamanashiensis TaxID=42233 RepID=A0A8J3YBL7_9ACTN|nr:hypothetical protein [Spirilliplanes yamanashiensis]MDP9816206.1 energy-converting hydrogenase Eha subunit E [Spirilliplanes yamanashiensis]GIJ05731.1 hypothetical protein Sya03_50830 [Spirilliplanes yamanashiensis]
MTQIVESQTTTRNRPLAGWAAAAGGVASMVGGAVQAVRPADTDPIVSTSDHVILTVTALALVLWIPAYLVLGRDARRAVGTWGGRLAAFGAALLVIGMTSTNLHGQDYSWFSIVAVPANLAWLAGSVCLAVATWRSRTLPRWLAVGVALVWPCSIFLAQSGGGLVAGAVFVVVGWLMVARGRA